MSTQGGVSSPVEAVVAEIREGKTPFAVAYPRDAASPDLTEETSITFSLSRWKGEDEPEPGQRVILEGVTLYELGWRARRARPIVPASF